MPEPIFSLEAAAGWTDQQWNDYTSSPAFLERYICEGVADINLLVTDLGPENYILLLDKAPHIVQVGKQLISSDTPEGKQMLTDELYDGKISLVRCVKAGVISGNEADDRIQDAMTAADMCLRPKRDWDERNLFAALHWSPDEWHEGMKYIEFSKHYSSGGVLDAGKIQKYMPKELFDRMVERAPNLVRVEEKIIDTDTVAGMKMIDKALQSGDVRLDIAIACGAYTKEEGVEMCKSSTVFAAEHLVPEKEWGNPERAEAYTWINEQWDAFVDTPQFDAFVEDGAVDTRELHKLMGPKLFNHMVDRSKLLIELHPRVIDIARQDGRAIIDAEFAAGNVRLAPIVRAEILSQSEMDERLETAKDIGYDVFEGDGWSQEYKDVVRHWSMDEWDAALDAGGFSKKYTKNGIVDIARLRADMDEDIIAIMIAKSIYLIQKNNGIIDGHTPTGAQLIEEGLWNGDTSVEMGLALNLLSREDALALYKEAERIGKKYREGSAWSEEDRESAMTWSADQWERAVMRMELAVRHETDGVLDSAKLTLAMGPDLYEVMVRRVSFLHRDGKMVIDGSTKEGAKLLGS